MTFAKLMCGTAMAIFGLLATPVGLAAQKSKVHSHQYHHYQLVDVGTFGGPNSFFASGQDVGTASVVLNQRGVLVGWADTSMPDPYPFNCFTNGDCYLEHPFELKNRMTIDLGVLVNGFSGGADGGINDSGLIAGTAENGELDPLIPDFPEIRSVLWENGVIHDLGTLPAGGYESYSTGINNRGQVVGVAGNTVPYQSRAFLWGKKKGMQDLGTLPGETDSEAGMINEPGQVVGWSYNSSDPSATCYFGFTTRSFIWERKNGMKDLGGLGGTCSLAADLNNRGQIVGYSNLPGDQFQHAFAWDRTTGITDLGTLGGNFSTGWAINQNGEAVGGASFQGDLQNDAVLWRKRAGKWQGTDLGTVNGSNCSFAFSINDSEQVVGISGPGCSLASLWEDGGPMVDLNTLVSPDSGISIQGAATINDRGEIAAGGTDGNGNGHALLLIPCDGNHPGVAGCDYTMVDASAAVEAGAARAATLPAAARNNNSPIGQRGQLRARFAHRYPGFGVRSQK
jgi:probable HAF family extracellular repeat protein